MNDTPTGPGNRRALLSACLGTLVMIVAYTAPQPTLNETARALGAGAEGRTWILSSMSIGLGAFLLTAGRAADDYGPRRAFVSGAVLLGTGSLAGLIADNVTVFVLGRVLQGVGGAALLASGLALLAATASEPRGWGRVSAVWGACVGGGIALGPLLSAGLVLVGSWRDVYAVLVAASGALVVVARGCPEVRAAAPGRLDLRGGTTLALGISALLAGLTEGREGWARPLVVALLGAAVVLLAGFVGVQLTAERPMLDLRLCRRPDFAAVTLAAVANGAGVIALLAYFSGFLGVALGRSPWTAAWLMLTWSVPSVACSLAARRLPERWNGQARMTASLLVVAAGLALLAGATPGAALTRFVPGLVVSGAGSGLLNAVLGRHSVTSVPAGQSGLGSGANNTARYLGSALGVTVVSLVAAPSGTATTASLVAGWNRAALVATVITLAGALVVLLVGGRKVVAGPGSDNRSLVEAVAA